MITWGFFIAGVISNNVQVFSQAFNQALAETIAATIYIIILLVLTFSLVGTVIVFILGLIDVILTLLCETGISPGLKKEGVCFTISGALTESFVKSLYNYAPMVDTANFSDFLRLGAPDMTLKEPTKGLVDSNKLQVTMPVTTTVHHRIPNPAEGVLIYPYGWLFYTPDNLASSTVKATITSPVSETVSVNLGQMSPPWNVELDRVEVEGHEEKSNARGGMCRCIAAPRSPPPYPPKSTSPRV